MQDHRLLEVYQLSRELAVDVYSAASALSASERFDFARQIRRAAVSIRSNIADGCGRSTRPDFRNFLGTALGSATELELQLELCIDTGLASRDAVLPALQKTKRVQQMLTRLVIRVGPTDR